MSQLGLCGVLGNRLQEVVMQKSLLNFGVPVILFLLLSQVAFPCGDKFLVVGRGMRYGTAKHPASILIYSHNAEQAKDLQSILKMAGHKLQMVSTEMELNSSVAKNPYDLVLMDLNDAVLLERNIEATAHKPAVVPVIYTQNGTELANAASKYACILHGEKKNRNIVKVVDSVMEEKTKGAPLKCEWSK
jgi:CheY-like chemotaxis protein